MKTTRMILGLCIFALSASASFAQTINTVAGNGTYGYSGDGGPATAASLHSPNSVAVDASGNIYIADTVNNCIRKVDAATGIITTIAGAGGTTGAYGGDGGPATLAALNKPSSICLDTSGNLYIADYKNHVVRKIDTSGIITTIAGDGAGCVGPNTCGDGGPATAAQLYSPSAVAVDNAGNVYIADEFTYTVRKVSAATGIIITIAGDPNHFYDGYSGDGGPAQSSLFEKPMSLAFDASGNLYIADYFSSVVRKITAISGQITGTCIISRVAGTVPGFGGDGGPATSAKLSMPSGLAVDAAGNIYITDQYNRRIRKINTSNIISTFCGTGVFGYSGDGGPATSAQIEHVWQLAVDACGSLYLADGDTSSVIRKISNGTTPVFNPSIISTTPVCGGSNISATGNYSGTVPPNSYLWQLQSCTSSGIITGAYNSGVLTFSGSPTGAFSFPNTSNLPCNQNYLITFTVNKNCPAPTTATTTKLIFINCKPAPVISGNAPICKGGSTTLCVNYQNNAQYTVQWTYYVGMTVNHSSAQCITVSPTATTSYNVSVKDNVTGCTGNASFTVAVIKSDPEFTYQTNYTSPNNYFTVTAKPVAPYNTTAGVGDFWIIEQLDASGNLIPGTNTILGINPNPNCWWGYPAANTFKGFDGTQSTGINNVTCPNPSPGKFANGGTYRITHGIWNDFCPWSQASHTITVIGNRVVEDPTRNANVPDFSHLKPSSKKQ